MSEPSVQPFPDLPSPFACYLAPEGLERQVLTEIDGADASWGRLIAKAGTARKCAWAQNIWLDPAIIEYASINDAARKLKSIQRNWAPYPFALHRRTALIASALPHLPARKRPFPSAIPSAPMGGFTLLDEGRLIASPTTSSPFANGEIQLEEDKKNPPSRAYLKLEEALSILGAMPAPGSACLDAGASPGGWTWVLRRLGASVVAIDRTELSAPLMADPLVRFLKHSAFTLRPQELGRMDWVFSDLICYPDKLLDWARSWLDSGLCGNFVCTVKMQGEPDWETMDAFSAIPGSRLLHLSNNKHELTWMRLDPSEAAPGA
jgi:23S rRNA (cytidine2498-2'-O)-methyltransferase